MVLPLEGVSRVAVILRFYRWRGCSCASLAWGWAMEVLPWRVWRGLAWGGWLAWGRLLLHLHLLSQVLVASPTTQVGRLCLPGLGAGTGPGVGPRDSRG